MEQSASKHGLVSVETSRGKNVTSSDPRKAAVVPMIKRRLVAMGHGSPKITLLKECRPGVFSFKALNSIGNRSYAHIGYFEFDAANSENFGGGA